MALAAVKTFLAGEILLAADLNALNTNILDNALSLVSPWTANMSAGGFRLTTMAAGTVGSPTVQPTGDTNTGIYWPAADTTSLAGAGVDVLRAVGAAGGVNYHDFRSQSAGNAPELQAAGTDTNISLRLVPKGTGYVQIATAGGIVNADYVPGLAFADFDSGFVQVVSGTLDMVAQSRQVLRASGYLNATNYIRISNAQASATPYIEAQGADTNVGLVIDTQAAGALQLGSPDTGGILAATYFLPAAIPGGTPDRNALYRKNVPKAWISFSSTPTLLDSYNITSFTDEAGAGDVSLTFDRDFLAVNYCVLPGNGVGGGSTTHMSVADWTVGGVRMRITDMANTLFDASGYLAFFGDQ